jgi:hypothetical protein
MGEDTGGAEAYRKHPKLSTSQYKAQDGSHRCWPSAGVDVSQSKAKAVASDCSLSFHTSLFLPAIVLKMVGEGDVGQSLCPPVLAVSTANGELGDLFYLRARLKRQWKVRRWGNSATVWAVNTNGPLDATLFYPFANCRNICNILTYIEQA